jgi:hypothetical protein
VGGGHGPAAEALAPDQRSLTVQPDLIVLVYSLVYLLIVIVTDRQDNYLLTNLLTYLLTYLLTLFTYLLTYY